MVIDLLQGYFAHILRLVLFQHDGRGLPRHSIPLQVVTVACSTGLEVASTGVVHGLFTHLLPIALVVGLGSNREAMAWAMTVTGTDLIKLPAGLIGLPGWLFTTWAFAAVMHVVQHIHARGKSE